MILDYLAGKANKKLADIGAKVTKAAEVAKKTGESVLSDIETRVNEAYQKIEETGQKKVYPLIDEMCKEGYFKDISKTIFDYAKDPKQAKEKLSEKVKQYDSKLAELAITEPNKAGFVDGFVHAYLSSYEPNRNRKSSKYREAARIGEYTGYAVAGVTFLAGGGIIALGVSTLPASTRLYDYLKTKVYEAGKSTGTGAPT